MKIVLDDTLVKQIREGEGPIELVDAAGMSVGVVRRKPTEEEIRRAKSRASRGGPTMTWEELMAKVRKETGLEL